METGIGSGLVAVGAGLAFITLVWVLTRWALRLQPSWQASIKSPEHKIAEHGDAVLLIRSGGRVEQANAIARAWFGLVEGETPSLERLARRARPSDVFWQLCVSEGQARFSVGGKLVEGISYRVPGAENAMMVVLRQPELAAGLAQAGDVSGSVLRIITDFGQATAENLNLEATLRAVISNVEKLVPADVLEIKVWNQASQSFVSYRFGVLDGETFLERGADTRFGNYSAYIAETEAPLFVADTEAYQKVRFWDGTDQFSLRSYMGIPLHAGGELVGILEVGQIATDAYTTDDQDILHLIAGQSAVAIRNALLYENEQRRAVELESLANLAQAAGSLQNREAFFGALVENIRPLFDVNILGFLLYDEDRRVLEAQDPFYGIQPHVTQIYRANIQADSSAEEILDAKEMLVTLNAATDERWQALRLHNIAQASSLHETALIPLISSGRFLGYLQFSNHAQAAQAFTNDEIHLMSLVANQTATIIDNASLVLQTSQRARRAETMRRVASLVSSSATLEETIRFSVRELVQLLKADSAVIFLLDEEQGALNALETSLYGVSEEVAQRFSKLYIDDPQFRFTVTGSLKPFSSGNLQGDRRVLSFYRPMTQDTGMQSALVVPLIIRDRGVGEMVLGSRLPDFFTRYDLQAAMAVAEQLSIVLDASRASAETDESLRLRVDQLTALARVSRELSGSLNLKHLLQVVYAEGVRTTKADCGTITLFEPASLDDGERLERVMVLGCAEGDALTEIEMEVARSGKALLIDDALDGVYPASHEGVRSALVAPIAYQGKTVGLFHLHSMKPKYFDEETLSVVQTFAVQAAIALGNAYRYEEQVQHGQLLERHAETLSSLLHTTSTLELERPLADSLTTIAEGVREATSFDVILISVYDVNSGMLRRVTGIGLGEEQLLSLKQREQPYASVQQFLKPGFKLGSAYYIPGEEAPVVPSDLHIVTLDEGDSLEEENRWHPDDIFVFVLEDQYGEPLGMISLDRPRNGRAPDQTTVDALEIFAAQATLIINSRARLQEFQERVDALSSGLERQQRLLSVSQNDLPILLRKDLEQTITVQNLEQSSRRIRAGLEITEAVSRQLDASSALQALVREILTHMGMMTAFIAENTPDGPQLISAMGDLPSSLNPDALFGQRNPLRACLQTGALLLIGNLDESDEWRETALLSALKSKSLMALPIKVEGETAAAILAVSKEPMPALTEDDRQVYYQIARQTSVIFQNIHLLTSARRRLDEVNLLLDFSRTISDLDPAGIMEALLGNALQVIENAHAGVVLVWNEITERLEPLAVQNYVDNTSMEKIFYRYGEALPGMVFAERKARTLDEVNFARDYVLSAAQLLLYRQATGGRLPISSIVSPIQTGEFCLGVVVLDNFNKASAFQTEDEVLLRSLSQQVALSLQNVRLLHSMEERTAQLEALTEVTTTISASLQSEELIPSILAEVDKVIPYDRATLWLSQNDVFKVAAARGYSDDRARVGAVFPAFEGEILKEILRTGKPLSVPDLREDDRFHLEGDMETLSWLGVPLFFKEEVIGIMAFERKESGFYTLAHLQVAATFAGQAAVALENARLFQDSQDRATELNQLTENLEQRVVERTAELAHEQRNTKTLLDILTEVSASLDLDLALRRTLALLNETVGAEQGTVMLVNPEDNLLHYRAGDGYLSEKKDSGRRLTLKVGEGLAGWVVKHREAILIDDLDQDERWMTVESDLQRHRSAVAAPLMVGEDVIGVLLVFNRQVAFFSPEQLNLIQVIAGQVAVAINNANLYKLIREQAERLGNMLRNEQEEASRSQAILEAVADGVLVTDSQNQISFINASAERILGIQAERIANQTLKEFSGLFGRAANIWHEIIHEWSEAPSEDHENGADTYAEQLELEDGRIVLVHLAPVLMRNDFLGTVSIFRDITHEVEVDRLKSEFVATVSHELRTPMTSIRGYVDILLMGAAGALTENQTHFLEIIRNNTERLNILVADLLDISRLESGRITLTPQKIALKDIANDVISNLKRRSQGEEKAMNFSVDFAPDVPQVLGDPDRLRQIVNNLVENAYHYTPENGNVSVSIYVVNGGDEVQVDVSDNGVGIAEEDQAQVFERFYRGEDPLVLATPGTGLGLPIVKQLIEMHKGKIWLESPGKLGAGSTFSFTLPVFKQSE